MSEQWIVIPGWERFQHYGDREPIWIKVYLELRDKDEWDDLSYAERGLLVSVWMAYAASRGVLVVSKLAQKCGHATRQSHIDSLVQAGFIQLSASKPLALTRSREREVEKNKEEKKKSSSAERDKKPYTPRENVVAKDPEAAIEAMIRNGVIQDQVDLEAELRGYRLPDTLAEKLKAQIQ